MDLRMQSPVGPRVVIGGRERDYFSGTGYLGLHSHPEVVQAAVETIGRYGIATATSRGGYGEHAVYDQLEAEARRFFGVEKVLYYPSGYLSAAILAQGLRARFDAIFIDDAAHYSLWDGARAVGRPVTGFCHCDPDDLAKKLRAYLTPGAKPMVLSDGVFPISGEIAPAPAYREVLAEYEGAWLCLDDAHATGVLGRNGRGTLDHYGLQEPNFIAGHTLSKAIGGYGGLIPGPAELLGEVERASRVTVGASPPPLPVAAAAAKALELACDPEIRERLWQNVARARAGIRALGWELADTPVPILCLCARPGLDLGAIKNRLFERDICVAHVTGYSSTPAGGALRIAIFATHTAEQIDRLVEGLRQVAA